MVRSQLQTGDLLFFHGGDAVSSTIAKIEKNVAGNGDYTHVGLVVLSSAFPPGHPYFRPEEVIPYTFESTQSGALSDGVYSLLGKAFLGVQFRNLDSVVENYLTNSTTKITWAPLLPCWRSLLTPQAVLNVFRQYDGRYYELSMIDLMAAAYPRLRRLRAWRRSLCCAAADRWLFCSELVAHVLQDLQILPASVVCDNTLPVDFLPTGSLGGPLVAKLVPLCKTQFTTYTLV